MFRGRAQALHKGGQGGLGLQPCTGVQALYGGLPLEKNDRHT